MVVAGGEGDQDYGSETAIFISTLIVLYLMAVVFLVRRQINQVSNFKFGSRTPFPGSKLTVYGGNQ